MADWTWKQAVADVVLEILNRRDDSETIFTLADVYERASLLAARFPRNQHVRQKIRQILQRLRDDEFLEFHGSGRFSVNLDHDEIDIVEDSLALLGAEVPTSRQVVRTVRMRNTFLAAEIKRRYDGICQVCRQPVRLTQDQNYAEGHHLQPLGGSHRGPDVVGNIIVLCPNHHVMFDRGVMTIVPQTLHVEHIVSGVFKRNLKLHVESWHNLDRKYLRYHHSRIFIGKD